MSDQNYVEIFVTTDYGTLKGRTNMSAYGDFFYSFERIPYAEKPLGQRRFLAPEPIGGWSDVLDCTQPAERPLQKNAFTGEIQGSEDCLYLNIYVPNLETIEKLPVMVYLFGGGFEKGDPTRATHGPDYFMMRPVVLVTIGYRVGPMGFLSLADPDCHVPGNAGLKDQLLALKWVKENIDNFNGDKNNITLFGSSAGAASAHYLMLTPLARNLFHRAILMSGDALCPWALSSARDLPYRLAQANHFTGNNTDMEVLRFLQEAPGEDLVRSNLLTKEEYLNDNMFAFAPVVEPYDTETCILMAHPSDLLATAWGKDIPIMLGGSSYEGLLMYRRIQQSPFLLEESMRNNEHLLPVELRRRCKSKQQQVDLGQILFSTHFDQDQSQDNVMQFCDYASYKLFWYPKYRFIKSRVNNSIMPTYLYRFDFDSPDFNHQRIKYCGNDIRGVAHGDENSYLFFSRVAQRLSKDSAEFHTIERMINMWTAFAKSSHPYCRDNEECNWRPLVNLDNIQCLNIGRQLEVIQLPELAKIEIWESLHRKVEEEETVKAAPVGAPVTGVPLTNEM